MIGLGEQLLVCGAARKGDRMIPGFKIWPVITVSLLNQSLYHIRTGKAIAQKHPLVFCLRRPGALLI